MIKDFLTDDELNKVKLGLISCISLGNGDKEVEKILDPIVDLIYAIGLKSGDKESISLLISVNKSPEEKEDIIKSGSDYDVDKDSLIEYVIKNKITPLASFEDEKRMAETHRMIFINNTEYQNKPNIIMDKGKVILDKKTSQIEFIDNEPIRMTYQQLEQSQKDKGIKLERELKCYKVGNIYYKEKMDSNYIGVNLNGYKFNNMYFLIHSSVIKEYRTQDLIEIPITEWIEAKKKLFNLIED